MPIFMILSNFTLCLKFDRIVFLDLIDFDKNLHETLAINESKFTLGLTSNQAFNDEEYIIDLTNDDSDDDGYEGFIFNMEDRLTQKPFTLVIPKLDTQMKIEPQSLHK